MRAALRGGLLHLCAVTEYQDAECFCPPSQTSESYLRSQKSSQLPLSLKHISVIIS